MSLYNTRYFDEWDAGVYRDDLRVHFKRLYTDTRDAMCDALNPSWKPEDDFIITVDGFKTWTEIENGVTPSGTPYTVTKEHIDPIDRFIIRTKDKNIANQIWKMAKNGASFFILQSHFYVYTDGEV